MICFSLMICFSPRFLFVFFCMFRITSRDTLKSGKVSYKSIFFGMYWSLFDMFHTSQAEFVSLSYVKQHIAIYCNTLQQVAMDGILDKTLYRTATPCNTRHHTATQGTVLQHDAPYCDTQGELASSSSVPQHTAKHCNTLQL